MIFNLNEHKVPTISQPTINPITMFGLSPLTYNSSLPLFLKLSRRKSKSPLPLLPLAVTVFVSSSPPMHSTIVSLSLKSSRKVMLHPCVSRRMPNVPSSALTLLLLMIILFIPKMMPYSNFLLLLTTTLYHSKLHLELQKVFPKRISERLLWNWN